MNRRIPKSFIADLLSRIDIVDIIEEMVPLKKRGSNYEANCPFHSEKTASFKVSSTKQIFNCFGCGIGGNVIEFVKQHERLEFIEAIQYLADRAGLMIPFEGNTFNQNALYEVKKHQIALLSQTTKFFQDQLWNTHEGQSALRYLTQRGLTEETIRYFELGYAPHSSKIYLDFLANQPQDQKSLSDIGMLIHKNNQLFCRFFQRVIFPIYNSRSEIIGFGGRLVKTDNSQAPKYLNSSESKLFHKGKEIYHLHQAKKYLNHEPDLYVVEGYMDVIALYQAGIRTAVATLGTAVTPDHLKILLKLTRDKSLIFCFDGDKAGQKAAWTTLEKLMPLLQDGMMINFMFLPEGEDPDSFISTQGKDKFLALRSAAPPFSNFLIEHLIKNCPIESAEGKSRFQQQAYRLIHQMPDSTIKELLLHEIADRIGIPVKHSTKESSLSHKIPRTAKLKEKKTYSPLAKAISLLLQMPPLAQYVNLENYALAPESEGWSIFKDLVSLLRSQTNFTTALLLERWRNNPQYSYIEKLALLPWSLPEDKLAHEFKGIIHTLKKQIFHHEIEKLIDKSKVQPLEKEERLKLLQLQKLSKE